MKLSAGLPLVGAVLLAFLWAAPGVSLAHEGHDHGAETTAAPQAAAKPRVRAASGPFELVGLLDHSELVIYLDAFDTNAPITDATIEVETPNGPATPGKQGDVYRLPAPWAGPGSHSLIFTVTRGADAEVLAGTLAVPAPEPLKGGAIGNFRVQMAELLGSRAPIVIGLGAFAAGLLTGLWLRRGRSTIAAIMAATLVVYPGSGLAHEGHDHGAEPADAKASSDRAHRMADGAVFIPKPTQRILGIRTAIAQPAPHRKLIELPGRVIPDPNASGYVQASVSGRLSPPPGGFPRLGTKVKAGDVLALVTPPLQAIDVSDMRQKAGELDQQIDIVTKRIARYETLSKTGAVSRVTLDEAYLELKGLQERRAAIDRTRAEPERLVAPVGGIVAAANAIAGQIAESNAVVFQIIDPARLWVEALTFEPVADNHPAAAITTDGRQLTLAYRGAGLTDRSQAIPVHFAIQGEHKALRIGQLVTVTAPTGNEAQGFALPRASVVRGVNGQSVLFEHTDAERFEPRVVRTQVLDADRVLVREGLAPGKRIVVQGAELLNQVR